MTIKSQPLDFAVSIIVVAGCAFGTCKNSIDIPICSAIARTSSRTSPTRSLQAASKLSNISRGGIHPACPLQRSTGSDSVAVITVTFAFKAFAKAIPCLTPFLATSDPSVLKRILAYIGQLLCSSNIPLKNVIVAYIVQFVAISLSQNSLGNQGAAGDGSLCRACEGHACCVVPASAGTYSHGGRCSELHSCSPSHRALRAQGEGNARFATVH